MCQLTACTSLHYHCDGWSKMLAQAARGSLTVPCVSADVEERASANGPALERERCACCVDVADAATACSPTQMADAGEQSGRLELGDCHRCRYSASDSLDLKRRLWAPARSVKCVTRGLERGQMLETTAKCWGAPRSGVRGGGSCIAATAKSRATSRGARRATGAWLRPPSGQGFKCDLA